ncbi:MAG: type II toxin-antitoxin system VapC family toxin [Acidobacteriota bacterium]
MYVLDTDHLSLLEHRGTFDRQLLLRKLKLVEAEGVSTTIVSFEEQMRGRLAYLSRARTMAQQIDAYRRLREQLDGYRSILVLDFDESAAQEYQRLKGVRTRVGTMDLKIAAVVLANDATLLSRNLVDSRRVPNLRVEDWIS